MKTKYLLLGIACAGNFLFSSCIKEDWGVIPENNSNTSNNGEWNKNKTIDFYYITSLSENTTSEVEEVGAYLKGLGDACSVSIVDRADVLYYSFPNFTANYATKMAVAANRFSCFALNKYTGFNIEGSSILFNHKINSAESFRITNDCYVKFVPIMAKSASTTPIDIETPLATVRFSTEDQIKAASPVLNTLAENKYQALIIGTVKSSLVPALQSVAGNINGNAFTQVTKDENNEYQLFIIGPKSWVLRETLLKNIANNTNSYRISVEASVE